MKPLRRQSLVEQTAMHLREGIRSGRWAGSMPGVGLLADELDVGKDTIRGALILLENQGVIQPQGWGKRRVIVTRRSLAKHSVSLRIGLLLYEPLEQDNSVSLQIILGIRHALETAGHVCFIAQRTISECGVKVREIVKTVNAGKADAWCVYGSPHEILEWFAGRPIPVLAIGGRAEGLPIAATRTTLDKAMADCVDTLVTRGHRRIVLVCPALWRKPTLSHAPLAFLSRMRHHGIQVSENYNLPDWEESPIGLNVLFAKLFHTTPPTALLLVEPGYTVAALTFLAVLGLRVPENVSLVSIVSDPLFYYRIPSISRFDWSVTPHINRVVKWVGAVAHGAVDRDVFTVSATFHAGHTIAAAPRSRA